MIHMRVCSISSMIRPRTLVPLVPYAAPIRPNRMETAQFISEAIRKELIPEPLWKYYTHERRGPLRTLALVKVARKREQQGHVNQFANSLCEAGLHPPGTWYEGHPSDPYAKAPGVWQSGLPGDPYRG